MIGLPLSQILFLVILNHVSLGLFYFSFGFTFCICQFLILVSASEHGLSPRRLAAGARFRTEGFRTDWQLRQEHMLCC
jgi:hypothetical protein